MCIQIGMMDSKLPVRLHARALVPFSIRPFHRLPLTYFVDRSGKVVDEIVGLRGASDIEDAIKKTLAQGN